MNREPHATPNELAILERECRDAAAATDRKELRTRDIRSGLDEWLMIEKLTVEQYERLLKILLAPQQ